MAPCALSSRPQISHAAVGSFAQLDGSYVAGSRRFVEECSVYRCSTLTYGSETNGSTAVSTSADRIHVSRVNFTACESGTGAAGVGVLIRADTEDGRTRELFQGIEAMESASVSDDRTFPRC
jgi:hypothetical protein